MENSIACCTSQKCDRRLQCRRVSKDCRQDISAHYMCGKDFSLYVGDEIKAEVIEVLEEPIS